MTEKTYGRNKASYGVTERPDGWIEVRVYHQNHAMWNLLQQHMASPQYFLGRREKFTQSKISAQRWLAKVMDDYVRYFRQNQVKLVFAEVEPTPKAPTPPKPTAPSPIPRVTSARPGRKVALVACVSKKNTQAMAARDLYISNWFRKASAYVGRLTDEWYILSAKYGLVAPDTVIEPYNQTLKKIPAAARRLWATQVMEQLRPVLRPGDQVVILAGNDYRQHLVDPIRRLGCSIEIPMEGLRIGEQLRWLNQQLPRTKPETDTAGRLNDLLLFYELLAELERKVGGKRFMKTCHGRMDWPRRGVYFFFEQDEYRSTSGKGLRVVRVGTHGLKAGSKSTLWGRLRQHRGTVGGRGNHRGSVFRLHVGAALLAHDSWPAEIANTWAQGSSAPKEVREYERPLEEAVSQQIQHMGLLWLEIDDEPGRDSQRGYIERNTIALLSNFREERGIIDPSSASWLGRWADRKAVGRSGLWNVNHVDEQYDPAFLAVLERLVD